MRPTESPAGNSKSTRRYSDDMYPEQAAAPVPTFAQARPQLNTAADALILAGAVVGIAMTALMVLMSIFAFVTFQTAVAGAPFDFPMFAFWMPVVFVVFGAVTIAGAIIALSARNELKRTNGAQGSTKAIVAGAVMIVGMGMLGGLLVLIGGILAAQRRTGA